MSQVPQFRLGAMVAILVGGCLTWTAQADDSSTEAELIALGDSWIAAEVQHDQAALERILDERFLLTFTSGKTIDRAAFIEWIMKADVRPFEVVHEVIQIHGDVAVLIDSSTDRTTKFTWIAKKDGGQWRVISETFSSVAAFN